VKIKLYFLAILFVLGFSVAEATKITRSGGGGSSSGGVTPVFSSCTITWTATGSSNPTITGTNYQTCKLSTVGKMIWAWYAVDITSGTNGDGTYLISIPGGGTIDTTNLTVSTSCEGTIVGKSYINQGGTFGIGHVGVYSSTQLCIRTTASSVSLDVIRSGYFGFADAKKLSFSVEGLPLQ
jgi:hypothetical protein